MALDPAILSSVSALMGALIGGGTSMATAVYTQRLQNRVQRVANEITKREDLYAEFIMNASNLVLKAYVSDGVAPGGDEQHLIGLINRMRLFAPPNVISEAEAVLKTIIEISLRPSMDLTQLAKETLSKPPDPDPLLKLSLTCRADLDDVNRTMV
jgi:hypothetical protein